MAIPQAVEEAYATALAAVRTVEAVVGSTVQRWASANDHLFKDRVKTSTSVSEKLETGRFESWTELDDLYACTVVVPTPSHIEGVLDFLRAAFVEVEVRGRGVAQKPADVFRFDAPRFIGTLTPQPEVGRPPGAETVLFEVQILTAFEYAWTVATHDLVYKGDRIDWRRARLAAHLKAAAEEADILITSFEKTSESIPLSPDRDSERRERVASFFQERVAEERLPATLVPASWSRLTENVIGLLRSVKRDDVDGALDALLTDADAALARGPAPVSGSMFQFVIGAVAGRHGVDALRRYVVVESAELRDLYAVTDVPKPFRFV